MAPAHLRGGLNMMFQLTTTLGIFTANMINYGTEKIKPSGWRLSLGLAAVPALLMTVGGFLLPETANSLIEQGLKVEGQVILEKIRGTRDVDAEFQDMIEASELANSIKHPFRNILEPRNRPQLVMAILFMPMFQILTGINSILFYATVLFESMGFGGHASLYSSVLNRSSCIVYAGLNCTVDKWGRRALLIGGWIQMIICQVWSSCTERNLLGGRMEIRYHIRGNHVGFNLYKQYQHSILGSMEIENHIRWNDRRKKPTL